MAAFNGVIVMERLRPSVVDKIMLYPENLCICDLTCQRDFADVVKVMDLSAFSFFLFSLRPHLLHIKVPGPGGYPSGAAGLRHRPSNPGAELRW